MLEAYGWALARSSRHVYAALAPDSPEEDAVDEQVDRADELLFDALEAFLRQFIVPDLDWHFRRYLNNDRGILLFSSSCNHRGNRPSAVAVLEWLASHGSSSRGIVYLRDDEDPRDGGRHAERYRVWRLLGGVVEEMDDPFLGAITDD